MVTQPLIINEWQDAIGESPNVGIGYIKNASIDSVAGSIMPNYASILSNIASSTSTFTWNVSGTCDLNTTSAALESTGVAVTFSTAGGGTLDTAITAGTVYFLYKFASGRVIIASSLKNAFNSAALALNNNGSGTCTVTTVDPGNVQSMVNGYAATTFMMFAVDSNGRVWFNDGGAQTYLLHGNTLTNGFGQGIVLFTNSDLSGVFLFIFRSNKIDIFDVTTQAKRRDPAGTSSVTSAWQTLTGAAGYSGSHQALLGQDNIIYYCDNQYVGSILEIPGQIFAPGTPATYTFNSKALTIPAADVAQSLEQLGINLLVGGLQSNLIYPWDRSSPSFGLPYICPETGIYGMKNIGNVVYILAGLRGIVYKTTGYLVSEFRKLPEHLFQGTAGTSSLITWGGVGAKNGALIVGASSVTNTTRSGVYLIFPDGRVIQENTPSLGALLPRCLSTTGNEFYFMGYAGGIDTIDTNRQNSFGAVFQSKLYDVGTKIAKATFSRLEVQLDQPGAAGGHIRVSYRNFLSGSFTTLDTYTTDGTSTSFSTDIGLTDIENIQFQVELDGTGNGSNATRLREVRLIP